jgi:hypothetical protein
MGHRDRSRFGGEELGGQDPLPASRSCHGNHEGKEGMEWKVSRESLITMGWLPTGQTVMLHFYQETHDIVFDLLWTTFYRLDKTLSTRYHS